MNARKTPHELGFRMPAEWEPHHATWLAWPHNASDWPGKGLFVQWVFVEMARCLHDGERIHLIVGGAREERAARAALERSGVALGRVDCFRIATNRSWTRDSLPSFVVRGRGKARSVAAVKWRFNGWARYRDYAADDAAGFAAAKALGMQLYAPTGARGARIVLEGGAIDVDGQGTLLATEQCLLSGPQARNRALGRAGIERALAEQLGVTQVIWLPDGIAGDDTSGHVDDFVRFVAPGRVVLAREPRRGDPNHRSLRRAHEWLRAARDARGNKLEIIPLPMPEPVSFAGQRLPASYANFYIGNNVVLVPTFDDPADRHALGLLAELFPDRRVIGIYCRDLVLGLGTLHCSTQQQPVGRVLKDLSRSETRA
jgi:agmatine deiminase